MKDFNYERTLFSLYLTDFESVFNMFLGQKMDKVFPPKTAGFVCVGLKPESLFDALCRYFTFQSDSFFVQESNTIKMLSTSIHRLRIIIIVYSKQNPSLH